MPLERGKMQPEDKRRILKNIVNLKKVDPMDLVDYFIQEELFDLSDIDRIISYNPNSVANRWQGFAPLLFDCGPRAYKTLLLALEQRNYIELARSIRTTQSAAPNQCVDAENRDCCQQSELVKIKRKRKQPENEPERVCSQRSCFPGRLTMEISPLNDGDHLSSSSQLDVSNSSKLTVVSNYSTRSQSYQSASKKLCHIFTDEQLHALEAEWNVGLTSVKDGGRIENLANSLNLTVQQIRDWIGNKLQRQKHSIQQPAVSSSASKPVPMQLKGPSGYNMFCKGKSLDPSSSGPTFVQCANEWRHLPASEKAKYTETAEERRQNLSASVNAPKLIRHHLKLISQSCEALNDVGVNIGGLYTDSTRRVGVFGNMRAEKFFQNVEWKDQFVTSMMDSQTNSSPAVDEVEKNVSQVRPILNDCWAKATGMNKVLYKTIKDNMYSVEIRNMPNGVKFRANKVATSTSLDEPCQLNQGNIK